MPQGNVNSTGSAPGSTPASAATDGHSLEYVVSLLEQLVKHDSSQHTKQVKPRPVGRDRIRAPCVICSSMDHDTTFHCRRDKFCFRCHTPGHQSMSCHSNLKPEPAVESLQQG
ncbi:hypothetical protein LDENG_00031280, partial [Lucifuga dentata]